MSQLEDNCLRKNTFKVYFNSSVQLHGWTMEHILITKMLIVCEQIYISLLSMNELNKGSVKIELFSNVIWSEQFATHHFQFLVRRQILCVLCMLEWKCSIFEISQSTNFKKLVLLLLLFERVGCNCFDAIHFVDCFLRISIF